MNKCYITGKITGLDPITYKLNFQDAEKEVWKLGMIPCSPLNLPHNHGCTWSEYMREDLIAMLGCTHVYALSNWRESKGATIEMNLALTLGLNIIHQENT